MTVDNHAKNPMPYGMPCELCTHEIVEGQLWDATFDGANWLYVRHTECQERFDRRHGLIVIHGGQLEDAESVRP